MILSIMEAIQGTGGASNLAVRDRTLLEEIHTNHRVTSEIPILVDSKQVETADSQDSQGKNLDCHLEILNLSKL